LRNGRHVDASAVKNDECWSAGLGVRPNLPSAHRGQQQSGQLHAQRHGDGQDEGWQAWGAEKIAVPETKLHVPAAELRSVARQRLFDRQVCRQTPTDVTTALDHE